MATTQNLIIDQGSDYTRTITILDGTLNLPVDITGYTFAGQIRKTMTSNAIAASFTFTLTDPLVGKVLFSLGNDVTAGLVEGRYVYDIEMINAVAKKFRIVEGIVTINPNVTR